MSSARSSSARSRLKRRWLQFSLRRFLVVLLSGLLLGWMANVVNRVQGTGRSSSRV